LKNARIVLTHNLSIKFIAKDNTTFLEKQKDIFYDNCRASRTVCGSLKNQLQASKRPGYTSHTSKMHTGLDLGLFSAEYHRTIKKHILEYTGAADPARTNGFNHSKKGWKIRRRREGG